MIHNEKDWIHQKNVFYPVENEASLLNHRKEEQAQLTPCQNSICISKSRRTPHPCAASLKVKKKKGKEKDEHE